MTTDPLGTPDKVTVFDIGEEVVCDLCNKDYTGSPATGGFLFGSKGVCPDCAPAFEAEVKKYHEEHFIRDRARDGETFQHACLRWRGGDNTVTITSYKRP